MRGQDARMPTASMDDEGADGRWMLPFRWRMIRVQYIFTFMTYYFGHP